MTSEAPLRQAFTERLPADWTFEGRRLLDFACGSGRFLSELVGDAEHAEIWGCSTDASAIGTLREKLCPPLHALVIDEQPPLPFEPHHFDAIRAQSVFSRIGVTWSDWLAEFHRVLKPGGLLFASVATDEAGAAVLGERWDRDRIGMLIRGARTGPPRVLHSRWWIEAHWGRGFELLDLSPMDAAAPPELRESVAVLRRRNLEVTTELLEQAEPEEPRELAARRAQLAEHRIEGEVDAAHGRELDAMRAELERLSEERDRAALARHPTSGETPRSP